MDSESLKDRLKYRKRSFLAQRVYSFKNALRGVFVFLKEETHSKIIIAIAVLTPLLGLIVGLSALEWVAVVVAIALVVLMEMINSAIERIIDLLHPEWATEAGLIKDITAGATLVASVVAVIIGLIVFVPKLVVLL